MFQALLGFHVARRSFAAHLTFYYFPDDVLNVPTGSGTSWANLSFEFRF